MVISELGPVKPPERGCTRVATGLLGGLDGLVDKCCFAVSWVFSLIFTRSGFNNNGTCNWRPINLAHFSVNLCRLFSKCATSHHHNDLELLQIFRLWTQNNRLVSDMMTKYKNKLAVSTVWWPYADGHRLLELRQTHPSSAGISQRNAVSASAPLFRTFSNLWSSHSGVCTLYLPWHPVWRANSMFVHWWS